MRASSVAYARARPGRPRPSARGPAAAAGVVTARPISSPAISRWRSSTPSTGAPSTSTIRSSARSPRAVGGAAFDHLHDLDPPLPAERRRQPRRQRTGVAGDADVGAAEPALAHQRADDPPRRRVDRNGEAEPDAGDGGVDPDDAARAVGERAARVARVERGVGLDHVLDDPRRRAGPGRQRAAERRDDTGRDRPGEAVRVPDRDDELADLERSASPSSAATSSLGSVRSTARSESGSAPTTSTVSSRPSTNEATPRSVPATTCAEVSTKPSGVITTPLPPPSRRRPRPRGATRAGSRPTARAGAPPR